MAYVYRHIRHDKNEPFYIGIGSDIDHRRANRKTYRNTIWQNIVAKTLYDIEIVIDDISWEEAQIKEKEFVKLYGRIDIATGTLANLTDGGEGAIGRKISEETRIKMRNSKSGHVLTHEDVLKSANARRGKPRSIEHNINWLNANKGKSVSPQAKINITKGRYKFTENQINNIKILKYNGLTAKEIATIYNCNMHTIYKIVKNKTYKLF